MGELIAGAMAKLIGFVGLICLVIGFLVGYFMNYHETVINDDTLVDEYKKLAEAALDQADALAIRLDSLSAQNELQAEYISDLDSAYDIDTENRIKYVKETARIRPNDRRDSIRAEIAKHDTIEFKALHGL